MLHPPILPGSEESRRDLRLNDEAWFAPEGATP